MKAKMVLSFAWAAITLLLVYLVFTAIEESDAARTRAVAAGHFSPPRKGLSEADSQALEMARYRTILELQSLRFQVSVRLWVFWGVTAALPLVWLWIPRRRAIQERSATTEKRFVDDHAA